MIHKPLPINSNPSCQHHRIDNATWQCLNCGERMELQHVEAKTVLSAPNAAAGTGVYVPDMARQKRAVVGEDVTYQCARCSNNGSVFTSNEPVQWDCGRVHAGVSDTNQEQM